MQLQYIIQKKYVNKQNFLMPFICARHWHFLGFGTKAPVDLLSVLVLSVKIPD